MTNRFRHFALAVLCIFLLSPASSLPTLSAHRPTLTADTPAAPASHRLPTLPLLSPLAGVAIKVKDVGSIAQKFKTRASAAQGDYGTGVANAGADWEANSVAAEDNYGASVTQAVADKRYGKGVRGSAGKYVKNATTLGPQRYGTGIANAQDAYAAGMQPVIAALQAINLPPRQVKGNNAERSNIVATRLRAMKLGKAS